MTTLIIITIILIFAPVFAFYMAASKNRGEHDWRSKVEDYINSK